MPDATLRHRFQACVLWPVLLDTNGGIRVDGDGEVLVDTMREIRVRWKWAKNVMMDAKRGSITVDATVRVGQDITVGSLLWLGSVNDFAGTGGPQIDTPEGLCQVKVFNRTSDYRNRSVSRTLGVIRYRGRLPSGLG